MTVLIVEVERATAHLLKQACLAAGYTPQVEGDLSHALNLAHKLAFDFILLGQGGAKACRCLRAVGVQSWLLLLGEAERVEGLDAGADDVVVLPVVEEEVIARMRALARRHEMHMHSGALRVGDLTLDPVTRWAKRDGQTIRLSWTEYTLLEVLMSHAGQTLTRKALLDHVWGGANFAGDNNVLDCYISYLRAKIDKGRERLIHTERGVGFRVGEQKKKNMKKMLVKA